MRLAKWGWTEIGLIWGLSLLLAASLGYYLGPVWAIPPLVGLAFTLYFFRDPQRTVPDGPGLVVSPADGRVMDIEQLDEPEFIGGPALRIGIFLSLFDVHVNRAPVEGTVDYVLYRPGKFLAAYNRQATTHNESNAIGLRHPCRNGTENADESTVPVLVRQIAGVAARRIVCDAGMGDQLRRGERFGMIKFGSRTEIYLPADAAFERTVRVGDVVRGGVTILGRLL